MTEQELQDLDKLAELMDSRFHLPGTDIRFGLDSVLGLMPGVGDTATILITLYLVSKAEKYNLPKKVIRQMYRNAAIDWGIGLIPLAGDIFDVGWKANLKNVALLKKHAPRTAGGKLRKSPA
jgi:hypothetical protein